MKQRYLMGAGLLILLLALSGCSLLCGKPETKTMICTYPLDRGMTLHADSTVYSGAISVTVTDEAGTVYFDELLTRSYHCGIQVYVPHTYTVTAVWMDACGDVKVYLERAIFQ